MADIVVTDSAVNGLIGEYTEARWGGLKRARPGTRPYHQRRLYQSAVHHRLWIDPVLIVAIFTPFFAPPNPLRAILSRSCATVTARCPKCPAANGFQARASLPVWWKTLTGKTWTHPFGTAAGGWDMYYGVVWGTRTAIKVGVIIEGITLLLGILIGAISGFYGGFIDTLLMRITEVFMTFPFILSAMTLSAILTPIMGRGLVAGNHRVDRIRLDGLCPPDPRRYPLGARARLRAGCQGGGRQRSRIMFKHIIPNAIYPTLVVASLDIGTIVVAFAALSFLGIGTELGYADWGQLVSFARNWIPHLVKFWWILIFPGVALILFVLGWNLVGDALRDIMDPRMRGKGA